MGKNTKSPNETQGEATKTMGRMRHPDQGISGGLDLEKKLLDSEKRFRRLGEEPGEAMLETDATGMVTHANEEAIELTGYSRDDLVAGTHLIELFVETVREEIKSEITRAAGGDYPGVKEYKVIRKGGAFLSTLVQLRPRVEGEKIVGARVVIVDVSERKKTEEDLRLSLRELVRIQTADLAETNRKLEAQISDGERIKRRLADSENLYRTVVETAKDVIWTTDLSLKYTFVSPSVKEVLGFTVDEMLQTRLMDNMTPESAARVIEIFKEEIAMEQESPREKFVSRTAEIQRFRKDGSKMWIEVTATWLRDAQRQPIGVLGISRDISDRKKAEEALRRARDELEQRVLERTAELSSSNEKLLEALSLQKQAENALRESEERFRTLFESAQDCMFIKDSDFKYSHVNPAMLKWIGLPQKNVIGKRDQDIFPRDYAKQAKRVESRVLQGHTIETEQAVVDMGQQRIFNFVRYPMRNTAGKAVGVYGIARDLTDRKREESGDFPAPLQYPSRAMRETLEQAQLAARSDSVILFLGESGTGKDYLARYLHENSKRASGPFMAINSAALPEELIESELFGHEQGAFTGSGSRKRGLVELSEGGTLLLNELGELPLRLQAKLLSFLDTQSFYRVGGEKQISVNSRLLAATNRDLKREVEIGNFRPDLYFRLNVFSIRVPSLRERLEDLPILVQELLRSLSQRMGRSKIATVDASVMRVLAGYEWPGNVRELRNVLERALILCQGNQIRVEHLGVAYHIGSYGLRVQDPPTSVAHPRALSFQDALSQTKRELIEEALQKSDGSIKKAAVLLGITRDSLVHYMKSLGIRRR